MLRHRVGLALLVLALLGCGGDPISESLALGEAYEDIACACPELIGASSEAECHSLFEARGYTEAEEACLRRVYDAHPAEVGDYFTCVNDADRAYQDCVRGAVATCPPDGDALDACDATYAEASNRCPGLGAALADYQACFDGP